MGIGVHVEMLRRAAYACRPLVLIGIPAAITLAALVDRAPVANLIGFVVLVTAFALLAVVALTHLLDVLRRRDGDAGPATRAAVLGLVMPGGSGAAVRGQRAPGAPRHTTTSPASRTVPCSATSSTTGSPSSSLVALRPRCSTST